MKEVPNNDLMIWMIICVYLSSCHCTIFSFRHPLLYTTAPRQDRKNKRPLFIAFILLHYKSDYVTFNTAFAYLDALINPGETSLGALEFSGFAMIGSDQGPIHILHNLLFNVIWFFPSFSKKI